MSDEELIQGLHDKSHIAQTELYRRYKAIVMSICKRMLYSDDIAQDATTDTFVKLFNTKHSVTTVRGISSWVCRSASNHCIDQIRSKRRKPTLSTFLDHGDDEQLIDRSTKSICDTMDDHLIYKAMDNVERNSDISWYLNVFKMNLDGCSIVGISESLGVNLNSCKSAHRRVKRSLKAELKRLHYDRY